VIITQRKRSSGVGWCWWHKVRGNRKRRSKHHTRAPHIYYISTLEHLRFSNAQKQGYYLSIFQKMSYHLFFLPCYKGYIIVVIHFAEGKSMYWTAHISSLTDTNRWIAYCVETTDTIQFDYKLCNIFHLLNFLYGHSSYSTHLSPLYTSSTLDNIYI